MRTPLLPCIETCVVFTARDFSLDKRPRARAFGGFRRTFWDFFFEELVAFLVFCELCVFIAHRWQGRFWPISLVATSLLNCKHTPCTSESILTHHHQYITEYHTDENSVTLLMNLILSVLVELQGTFTMR